MRERLTANSLTCSNLYGAVVTAAVQVDRATTGGAQSVALHSKNKHNEKGNTVGGSVRLQVQRSQVGSVRNWLLCCGIQATASNGSSVLQTFCAHGWYSDWW